MATVFAHSDLASLYVEQNWANAHPDNIVAVIHFDGKPVNEAAAARFADWAGAQPVPIVGIDVPVDHLKSVDIATTLAELPGILSAIEKNPQAASVLVQVTRATPRLNVSQALHVESMAYATLQGGSEFKAWLEGQPTRTAKISDSPPIRLAREGHLLTITLCHPGNRNALSVAMRDALSDAFHTAALDSSITGLSVNAEGPVFSAGGDLSEFGSQVDVALAHHIRSLRMPAQYLAPVAGRTTFLVHGACIGAGIELPAFGANLIAAPGTIFRLPEIAMGLIPGAGGCVSLPRRIGRHHTNRLALLGEDIGVDEALAIGLIDEIRPID